MGLALLPFFEHFKRDIPHRLAAVKMLEDSIPEELLQDDAAWIEAWKASGIDQEIWLPHYFRQFDLPHGARMCFTSAAATVAAFYRVVKSQESYARQREKFGDTSSVAAHIETLKSLGLKVTFTQSANINDVYKAVDANIPVMLGWHHNGPIEAPSCSSASCGHWSVAHGYSGRYSNDPSLTMTDPAGVPDLKNGSHNQALSGYRINVRVAEFLPRWQIEGPGSGWAIFVEKL